MPLFVEDGKSITSVRGIRGPHDEITVKDLPGATEEDVEELVARGVLYPAEMSKPDTKAEAEKRAKVAKAKKAQAKKPAAKKTADADKK